MADNKLPDRLRDVKIGDVIEGPWGRYEFRVTSIDGHCIEGVYTKVPERGYQVGTPCRYLYSDWLIVPPVQEPGQ